MAGVLARQPTAPSALRLAIRTLALKIVLAFGATGLIAALLAAPAIGLHCSLLKEPSYMADCSAKWPTAQSGTRPATHSLAPSTAQAAGAIGPVAQQRAQVAIKRPCSSSAFQSGMAGVLARQPTALSALRLAICILALKIVLAFGATGLIAALLAAPAIGLHCSLLREPSYMVDCSAKRPTAQSGTRPATHSLAPSTASDSSHQTDAAWQHAAAPAFCRRCSW
jgi:hypothetical protein